MSFAPATVAAPVHPAHYAPSLRPRSPYSPNPAGPRRMAGPSRAPRAGSSRASRRDSLAADRREPLSAECVAVLSPSVSRVHLMSILLKKSLRGFDGLLVAP